ncbi:MAG: hypothetical protein KBS43_02490 [Oscillospiraceae bacterium]|nr:hypothetical protein [Candidatus Limimonas coprohippi]MCQ2488871.1 hypothetical protein [Clostridia bacterium]
MDNKLPEYKYVNNPKTLSEVMIGFVRNILETVLPFLKIGPFPGLLDKLFASKFARSFLGSYAMLLLM